MKTKILFCLLVTLSVFSASAQSGAEWNAYKAANGINPSWTYNQWVAAGMPRGGGGVSQQLSPEQIAAKQAAAAAAAAQRQREADAIAENNQGLDAWNKEDLATAIDDFQKAIQNNPNNQTFRDNLVAVTERRDNKIAVNKMQQIIQSFAQNLNNSTVPSSGLDFDGNNSGINPNRGGNGNGLDFISADSAVSPKPLIVTANPQPKPELEFGDPMIVDARNVPSGLPKSVDAAIPRTPAGDGMRKGYEAIQDGDWKVALAWFQDALNKEPGDPDLQRLVDLSQFTLVYRSQPQTPPVENNSTSVQITQLPTQNSTINSSSDAVTKSGETSLDLAMAGSAAAHARADIVFKQYQEKYGSEGHIIERAAAVSAAMRGEGFTKEELKAQLQQALKDYHKRHNNADDNIDLGPATLDEISIGGKG